MNHSLAEFTSQFAFSPEKAYLVGIEQECFIADADGNLVPRAAEILEALSAHPCSAQFSYELSACQIERKTKPVTLRDLKRELVTLETALTSVLEARNLHARYDPVAPENMPLDVFPDPLGRYQNIAARMSRKELTSACRVIATNIHIGMPDHETALTTYNALASSLEHLLRFGDKSGGKRLAIYQEAARDWKPEPFKDWGELHRFAIQRGFAHDMRSWWPLVRISRHGTIEARWLDATGSVDEATTWAREFRAWCLGAA